MHFGIAVAFLAAVLFLPVNVPIKVAVSSTQDLKAHPTPTQDIPTLETNKPVERTLAGGDAHSYRVGLGVGQFLHVVIEQRGVDVSATLFNPSGERALEVETRSGASGNEAIFFVADIAGNYRLEIHTADAKAPAGRYEVKMVELRAAMPQDRIRSEAARLFNNACHLSSQKDATARRKAIPEFEATLSRYESIKDYEGATATLGRIGDIYFDTDEFEKAVNSYQQAVAAARLAKDRAGEIELLNNIGLIYNRLDDRRKALEFFNQALPLARSTGDKPGLAQTLINASAAYIRIGETRKAIIYLNESLPLLREIGEREGETSALINLGQAYSRLGEKQQALNYFEQGLQNARALKSRQNEAVLLNNTGSVYLSLGESQRALGYYNQALIIYRTLGSRRSEGITLNNVGNVYDELGEKQKALEVYQEALMIHRAVRNRTEEASTLGNIGLVYKGAGDYPKALEYYLQALSIHRETNYRLGEANTLQNIGEVYRLTGERQKAADYFNQSLSISRAINLIETEAKNLYGLAFLSRDESALNDARERIEAALRINEAIRLQVNSPQLRAVFRAATQKYYELYIDILMRLHQQRPAEDFNAAAFVASESARARTLLELLAESDVNLREGASAALLEGERNLQQSLNDKAAAETRLLSGKHTVAQATEMAREIATIDFELQDVQAQIRAHSPRYAALVQPHPLMLKEAQNLLDPNTLILEYALGEERSYVWAVASDAMHSYELAKRSEIEAAARRVYELLIERNREIPGESFAQRQARVVSAGKEYEAAAAHLSQMLFAPLAHAEKIKRLLVISEGALQYVPFAALPILQANGVRSATQIFAQPLIAQYEIISLPSISTLALLRHQLVGRVLAPRYVAALADPVFSANDPRVKAEASAAIRRETDKMRASALTADVVRSARETGAVSTNNSVDFLARLPSSRREALSITERLSPDQRKVALDFNASLEAATSGELAKYRIVHFATHALLNSEHPELSGIVLSLVDEQGRPRDGFLRLNEIYNLKLPAELVVLSACQTALGRDIRGEGLIGLTRGFMYAGTPRVVASLWKVDDKATAELMKHFYAKMLGAQHLRPAAALRAAQLEMMQSKQWSAPYYWSAFVLQGEWR